MVLFLEAKTEVTKSTGTNPRSAPSWERVVKWFARFWGYLYQ